MERNELLSATLAEYRRGFLKSVDRALMLSAGALFEKTSSSFSSADQTRFLDARGVLLERDADLRQVGQAGPLQPGDGAGHLGADRRLQLAQRGVAEQRAASLGLGVVAAQRRHLIVELVVSLDETID